MDRDSRTIKSPQTDNTWVTSIWNVLLPFLLYYITYHAAYIILAFFWNAVMGNMSAERQSFMAENASTFSGILGGVCMLLGILPLFSMLKRELAERAKEQEEAGGIVPGARGGAAKRHMGMTAAGEGANGGVAGVLTVLLTVFMAVCASLGMNALLTLTGLTGASETFQEVAENQFGTVFAIGIVLYGVVSPLAEEVVFRGLIYNRLRHCYSIPLAIVVSGALFGLYHGNLVQGVYGGCMGMVIAYVYERFGRFYIPVLFHGAANLSVYVIARSGFLQEKIFTVAGCIILLGLAAVSVVIVEIGRKKVI